MGKFFEVIFIVFTVIVLGILLALLPAWLLQFVLHGFGIDIGFWTCFGIIILLEFLLGFLRS